MSAVDQPDQEHAGADPAELVAVERHGTVHRAVAEYRHNRGNGVLLACTGEEIPVDEWGGLRSLAHFRQQRYVDACPECYPGEGSP